MQWDDDGYGMPERAVDTIHSIYRSNDLAIPRKAEKARQILALDWSNRFDGRSTRWKKAREAAAA